ncbi:MAG: carbamoyltransferase N-terminal domain-containing protein [Solirubrobacteraceae bacterium]
MIRLGLKLTHDGGFAVLDGTTLVCSHEAEKSDNLARHARLEAIDLERTLSDYGIALSDVDRVLVDGWTQSRAPGARAGAGPVAVAPYHENDRHRDPLAPVAHAGLELGAGTTPYLSYSHAAGHAAGAYATGPWARDRLPALVLVWDGAMLARLYRLDPNVPELTPLRPVFPFVGHLYPAFASYFGPFSPNGSLPDHDGLPEDQLLDLSGKAMAWVGLGAVDPGLTEIFERAYRQTADLRWESVFAFARAVHRAARDVGASEADTVATFQAFVGDKLVHALTRTLAHNPALPRRLCFAGGCALNIAWNARLRSSGLFEDVWVPPFPNDAGSALGCAAADLLRDGQGPLIDWDVYRGPELRGAEPAPGWRGSSCSLSELAARLADHAEPVVFLNGRAELGPRALGNRSILCPAGDPDTKTRLNQIKLREWYRPVAPICLEAFAPEVFDPGSPDPYMLFTHRVRPEWVHRVPAIVHLDGTARLQTVTERQNPVVARLLEEFRRLTGVPLLCNTSANLKGSGFFPDLRSATEWPGADHVWSDGVLYARG